MLQVLLRHKTIKDGSFQGRTSPRAGSQVTTLAPALRDFGTPGNSVRQVHSWDKQVADLSLHSPAPQWKKRSGEDVWEASPGHKQVRSEGACRHFLGKQASRQN